MAEWNYLKINFKKYYKISLWPSTAHNNRLRGIYEINCVKKRFTFLLFLFLSFYEIKAQDRPLYSQVFLNPYFYNPAMAGKDLQPALYLFRRQQWTGIEGAPLTNGLNFHTIFGRHALFGVDIYSDERSLLKTTTLLLSGGYRLIMGEGQSFNFALSAGAGFNSIDLSSIDYALLPDGNDPALNSALDNNIYLDGNAGISYQYNDFYIGLSLPRLFNVQYISSGQFDIGTFGPMNNLVAMTGMKIKFSQDRLTFEPVLIYHYSKNTPDMFEGYGIFHFYDMVWIGAGYRQNTGFSGFVGLSIMDHFKFGYAYEFSTQFGNGSSSFSNGSHEFQLAFLIGKKKTSKPRQVRRHFSTKPEPPKTTTTAFVAPVVAEQENKTEPTTPDTVQTGVIQRPANTGRTKEPVQVNQKPPEAAIAPTTAVTVETRSTKTAHIYTPLETLRTKKGKQAKKHPREEKEKKKKEKMIEDTRKSSNLQPAPVATDSLKTANQKQAPVKPSLDKEGKYIGPKHVKKGNHLLELEKGYYVVLGAFNTYKGAENYSDELFKRGFYTKYGYASETKIYYVYSYHSLYYADAKKESERLKKYKANFRENWVLTIE